jgi:hypothetical protein
MPAASLLGEAWRDYGGHNVAVRECGMSVELNREEIVRPSGGKRIVVDTQLMLQMDHSSELIEQIVSGGPILLPTSLPIFLVKPQISGSGALLAATYQAPTVIEVLSILRESVALSCTFDPASVNAAAVRRALEHTCLLSQLVKPRRLFCDDWFQLNPGSEIQMWSRDLALLPARIAAANPYLHYQRRHTLNLEDVETIKACLPRLQTALAAGSGSWNHPCGSIHRALILFAEGYSSSQFEELRQFLWAMALDCLFSSKQNKQKRGAKVIAQRLKTLFGAEHEPYSAKGIKIPSIQKRPNLKLVNIGEDIFRLRNSCAHGLPIPDAWLSDRSKPEYEGYAYQLCECTEILLRETLLLILTEQRVFDIFADSQKLDRYFG